MTPELEDVISGPGWGLPSKQPWARPLSLRTLRVLGPEKEVTRLGGVAGVGWAGPQEATGLYLAGLLFM